MSDFALLKVEEGNETRYAEEGNQEGEQDPAREFHLPRCNLAAASHADLTILKDNGRGNSVTYLIYKNGY